ncbi:hypothetical protein Avbf_13313 [Armadillidium vulgare]|nr:hypothetical protein Avbf_13313 [Armadillidium vulgare]
MTQMSSGSIPDVKTFFPQIENDLSLITWGHAINSMSLLEEAISDELYMMLEADVSKGRLKNETTSKEIPIMAHPPETMSDLSLQMFIDEVIKANEEGKKIGVKLDFKNLDIVLQSLEILRKKSDKVCVNELIFSDSKHIIPFSYHLCSELIDLSLFQ